MYIKLMYNLHEFTSKHDVVFNCHQHLYKTSPGEHVCSSPTALVSMCRLYKLHLATRPC